MTNLFYTISNPEKAGFWNIFLYTAIVVFFSIMFSYWFFPSISNLLMIILITIALVIPFYKFSVSLVKKLKEKLITKKEIIQIVKFFSAIILASLFVHTIVFTFLFVDKLDVLYRNQWSSLKIMDLTGSFSPTLKGYFQLVNHNLLVLAKATGLSLFFGTGGLFVTQYSLSFAPVLAGTYIRQNLVSGLNFLHSIFVFISVSISIYIHTFLEMFSFLTGGIASLLLAINLFKYKLSSKEFLNTMKNIGILIIAAIILVLIAALIEKILAPLFLNLSGNILGLDYSFPENIYQLIYK